MLADQLDYIVGVDPHRDQVAHRKRAGSRGAAALDLSPSGAPKASTRTALTGE